MRVDRENADNHMAFGQGTHFCLGAQLARTELQIALTTLLRRTDNWALVDGQKLAQTPSECIVAWLDGSSYCFR